MYRNLKSLGSYNNYVTHFRVEGWGKTKRYVALYKGMRGGGGLGQCYVTVSFSYFLI